MDFIYIFLFNFILNCLESVACLSHIEHRKIWIYDIFIHKSLASRREPIYIYIRTTIYDRLACTGRESFESVTGLLNTGWLTWHISCQDNSHYPWNNFLCTLSYSWVFYCHKFMSFYRKCKTFDCTQSASRVLYSLWIETYTNKRYFFFVHDFFD